MLTPFSRLSAERGASNSGRPRVPRVAMSSDPLWRALADPTRRRLIELLRNGPRTTGDFCRAFSTSRFAVMKHLHVLARAGLLVVHRVGRVRWNDLNPEPLRRLERRQTRNLQGPPPLEPPQRFRVEAVSYTHLTLPTNREV